MIDLIQLERPTFGVDQLSSAKVEAAVPSFVVMKAFFLRFARSECARTRSRSAVGGHAHELPALKVTEVARDDEPEHRLGEKDRRRSSAEALVIVHCRMTNTPAP